jgi:mono/diheme cytochrome c family protein
MTAEVVTVLALVAGISWLGLMVVSALRTRGGEEIAPNLRPGIDDQQLETRRLERGQKFAIAASAFLAVSLPIYFLGEPGRQTGFVEEFDHASVSRGERIVAEFACFDCHGPLGAGGSASFIERRSGVTVDWYAPPLDDIFYRYSDDEVDFWITYGRTNTPMPAWGLAGGGPMNTHQVKDVINYLKTVQRPQQDVINDTPQMIQAELDRLAGADAALEAAIARQEQVVAEIDQAAEDYAFIQPLAAEARRLLEGAGTGIDTDGDGLADVVEVRLSEISAEAMAYFRAFQPITLDPETPDRDALEAVLSEMEAASQRDPILRTYIARINEILENADGEDTDGDGIPDAAETQINALLAEAAASTLPRGLTLVTLSPTNPASVGGQPDMRTATSLVGTLESVVLIKRVLFENEDRIRPQEEGGLAFLRRAQQDRLWEIDIPGVARAMGVSEQEASRAVGLFQANCARCHTSGFSAGIVFSQQVGSGGFGPALFEGRPLVQFGPAPADPAVPDPLVDFLINGSVAQAPYGLNGMGSGRMPGFGSLLTRDDIELLAHYLRTGNLAGVR